MAKNEEPDVGVSHPVVARLLDVVMRPMQGIRARIIPAAAGRVLEVGAGTGLNFDFYRPDVELVGIEPDPHMLERAERRACAAPAHVELAASDAERLPFVDGSFDTVVATWVLCTLANPNQALCEMKRVLRPGGLLLFAEHTRSAEPAMARLQALLTPGWKRVSGGCHLDRDSIARIRRAGFGIEQLEAHGPTRWSIAPLFSGRARKPLRP